MIFEMQDLPKCPKVRSKYKASLHYIISAKDLNILQPDTFNSVVSNWILAKHMESYNIWSVPVSHWLLAALSDTLRSVQKSSCCLWAHPSGSPVSLNVESCTFLFTPPTPSLESSALSAQVDPFFTKLITSLSKQVAILKPLRYELWSSINEVS